MTKSTIERQEGNLAKITITIDAKQADELYARTLKRIGSNINIAGFRKGKAPNNVIEKYVGKERIKIEAIESVFPMEFSKVAQEEKLDLATQPQIENFEYETGKDLVINVKADAQGLFTTTYKPYAGQIGHFTVGACYPGEGITDGQSSFDIYGLKQTTSTPVTCETLVGQPYGGILQLNNPGTLPLTDVRVSVVSKPDNCNVDVSCPNTIAGGGSADISYSITSLTASSGSDWEQIKLKVETAEGASLSTTIYYYSRHTTGKLKADVENSAASCRSGRKSLASDSLNQSAAMIRMYPFL